MNFEIKCYDSDCEYSIKINKYETIIKKKECYSLCETGVRIPTEVLFKALLSLNKEFLDKEVEHILKYSFKDILEQE